MLEFVIFDLERHAPSTTEVTVAGQTTKYILSTNDVTLEAELPDIDYDDTATPATTPAQTDVTAEGRESKRNKILLYNIFYISEQNCK